MKRSVVVMTVLAAACLAAVRVTSVVTSANGDALSGVVTSADEGPMEGVLVSARRAGSPMTITVASDASGRYRFPAGRLEPGEYALQIRAVGYEIDGPAPLKVNVAPSATADLKLRKADDVAPQLSNAEWLLSMPGTDEQKMSLLRGNCTYCHTLERVVRTRYNTEQMAHALERMRHYAQGSTPSRAQRRPGVAPASAAQQKQMQREAEYLSSVNLSTASRWRYPLKTLPRPKGESTKVIITQYHLPRPEALPHDAAVDREGNLWYADFGSQYLGVIDPRTGKATEYKVPVTKPGAPTGALDLRVDRDGNVWLASMYQGAVAKFDRKTKTFQTWTAPQHIERDETRVAMIIPTSAHVDGKVWVGGDTEYQFDTRTNQWHRLEGASYYGVAADSKNNAFGMQLTGESIVRVDAQTRAVTMFPTPTKDSGPRRGNMDAQDRLWFAEFRGNRLGMFDTRTNGFKEWLLPTAWTNPYDAILDAAGYAWTGGMTSDRVVRLNTRTNEMVEYLLPGLSTNIRRVDVDNTTSPPSFVIGDNLAAAVVRVQPLP